MASHFKTILDGADDNEKLRNLCLLTYKEQAVWFLNAFWESGLPSGSGLKDQAEIIWDYVQKASVIDNAKATGNALDEMEAHRFLEAFHEAHTVLEMRSQLRKTGALAANERPKEVPLTHFLLFKYEVSWNKLVNAPQGDNSAQIAEAQDKLQAVQDAFDASTKADAEATAALKESVSREASAKASEAEAVAREADAKSTEAAAVARENEAVSRENEAKAREADAVSTANEAKAREADAVATEKEAVAREDEAKAAEAPYKAAEAPFKAAQDEVEAALSEVKAQEDAYNNKTEDLKKASEEGGVVARNRAKVQLDAHLAEDPLPLRKAKITLEAANKKAEKARAPFLEARAPFLAATEAASAARATAEAARKEAETARHHAEEAHAQAESARKNAENARKSAEAARQQAEAARRSAEAAREEAVNDRKRAEAARSAAEDAKSRAEAAVAAAQDSVRDAEALLAELLANPGSGQGALFWIDRELTEKKKFMPVSKGGIRK
jgi:hypothetical protein